MIDIATETVMTLVDAAKGLPGTPHGNTLWRWSERGVRGCKLEVVRIGGRVYTSRQALQRFANALSRPSGATTERSADRRTAIERSETRLTAQGI